MSHAEAYQEDFGYLSYPPEHYNVPFYVDPTAADGLTGIIRCNLRRHVPTWLAPCMRSWSANQLLLLLPSALLLEFCICFVGAAVNGSYKVVGNSGAVPIHALPFTIELLLFMTRGANYNGTQYSGSLNASTCASRAINL